MAIQHAVHLKRTLLIYLQSGVITEAVAPTVYLLWLLSHYAEQLTGVI